MAKQPTPAFRVYEQQSAPRPQGPNFARAQDVSGGMGGIANSLSRAGQAVVNFQEGQLAEEQIAAQRRRDDAHIVVAQRMAELRHDSGELRRTTFENAPDGWREATPTFAHGYEELVARHRANPALNTPEAQSLFNEQAFIFQQDALDNVAEGEQGARALWQQDATRAAIDQGGNVLVADPSQYEAMRMDMLETVGAISDANLRRDTTDYMEDSYSRYAVGGMIQADPRAALRALQDPNSEGAIARLQPSAHAQAINEAKAEIERRDARYRAQISQQVSSAEQLMELGLPTQNAPSVEAVRNALGADRALAYEARRAMSTQFGRLSGMTHDQLLAVASDTNPRDNEHDAILHSAEQRAAAAILEQRQTDPMQYQVRNGLVQPATLVEAFNQQDWGLVNGILQNRSAAAQENGRRLGMRPLPLTAFEANVLGPQVRAMTAEQRGVFMRNAAAWMGRDSVAYRGMMSQLFPDSPGTAYAGYLTGSGGETGARDAALILRGEDALGGRSADGEGAGRNRLLQMPKEDDLRRAWRRQVGDAYAPLNGGGGSREAEAQAYEVFRSAYAGLTEQTGATSDSLNNAHARRAAEIATGGIIDWNGRETLMLPGMSRQQFTQSVRDGFSRWQQLQNEDPSHYTLMPLEMTATGMRYGVYDGNDPVRAPNGRQVEIEVRR